jgi:coproporphyrinogen III oxidase-like Fe-S oxidoreductase
MGAKGRRRNPKSEIRNPKQIQNSNEAMTQTPSSQNGRERSFTPSVLIFPNFRMFGFVSDFGFRILTRSHRVFIGGLTAHQLPLVMLESAAEPIASLYVHVPFCAHKCSYCAFYSEPSSGEVINRYVAALICEMELVAPDLKPRLVFFGGGTPSLLNLRQWEQILRAMERLNLVGAAEWTVECNPATVSLDKAKLLRSCGVNRISMGVQSLDEVLLARLGRIHTRDMVFKSFDLLRQAGFDNLNLDLMFAIPGQTLKVWRETLIEAIAMGSEHLSSYELIYEEDTALYAQLHAGEFDEDEDLACAMYDELVKRATQAGFEQYEVANFARNICASEQQEDQWPRNGRHETKEPPQSTKSGRGLHALQNAGASSGSPTCDRQVLECVQSSAALAGVLTSHSARKQDLFTSAAALELPRFACRHNVNYWRGGSFYGLGPSATSYVRGVRTRNWCHTQLYCEQLERGQRAIESREELPPLARAGETAAFGLRMVAGWPFEQFYQVTGHDLRRDWAADMARLTEQSWGRLSPDRFQLTPQGLRFADAAAQLFLRP